MSAGSHSEYPGEPPVTIISNVSVLAPAFRRSVEAALVECHAHGLDAIVHETLRSRATARVYYRRGRTQRPPNTPVTNAPNELWSWHGYGLAVDVISKAHGWAAGDGWFERVAAIFKTHGCKWGGEWVHPDRPHFQWGRCRATPSDLARDLMASGGMHAVWAEVGAL